MFPKTEGDYRVGKSDSVVGGCPRRLCSVDNPRRRGVTMFVYPLSPEEESRVRWIIRIGWPVASLMLAVTMLFTGL